MFNNATIGEKLRDGLHHKFRLPAKKHEGGYSENILFCCLHPKSLAVVGRKSNIFLYQQIFCERGSLMVSGTNLGAFKVVFQKSVEALKRPLTLRLVLLKLKLS